MSEDGPVLTDQGCAMAAEALAVLLPLRTPSPERLAELERDAGRYKWLRGEVEGPHVPMAQVIWKQDWQRDGHQWTNLCDGKSLDEHVDAAIAGREGK